MLVRSQPTASLLLAAVTRLVGSLWNSSTPLGLRGGCYCREHEESQDSVCSMWCLYQTLAALRPEEAAGGDKDSMRSMSKASGRRDAGHGISARPGWLAPAGFGRAQRSPQD